MKMYYYVCETCKKEFSLPYKKRQNHIYCSLQCAGIGKRNRIEKICPVCNKTFYVPPCDADRVCCNSKCKHIYMVGKPNLKERKYGFLDTPAIENDLYKKWRSMKRRCYAPNCQRYKNYGGRGITVCQEWLTDFTNFYNWAMQNGYKEGLSIDRIDVNGNYEPSNCRWVELETQAKNRRSNIIVDYYGKEMILNDIAIKERLDYKSLWHYYKKTNDIYMSVEKSKKVV